jgi:hypothetical protein
VQILIERPASCRAFRFVFSGSNEVSLPNLVFKRRSPIAGGGPATPKQLPHDGGAAHAGAGVRKPPREMLWGGGEDIASIVADVNRWKETAGGVARLRVRRYGVLALAVCFRGALPAVWEYASGDGLRGVCIEIGELHADRGIDSNPGDQPACGRREDSQAGLG